MTKPIKIDLLQDLRNICNDILMENAIKRNNLDDPVIDYCRWERRRIACKPRKIHKPEGFVCPEGYEEKLRYLELCIESGEDLNPFQSKGINNLKLNDLMLYEWNIHHFHISNEVDKNDPFGFMIRSDYLLMAVVDVDDVYFIQIVPHSDDLSKLWTDRDYLTIIKNNWPNLISDSSLGEMSLSENIGDEEHYNEYRKGFVNVLTSSDDGTIYGSYGGGFTLDGTSIQALDMANSLIQECSDVQELVLNRFWDFVDREPELSKKFEKIEASEIRLTDINNDLFVLIEINTNFEFRANILLKELIK